MDNSHLHGETYGIAPGKKPTHQEVRDAMTRCFMEAHDKELEELRGVLSVKSEMEFQNLKKVSIEALVKKFLKEAGGDFDNPTKEALAMTIDKLAEYAANFRDQETIKKHHREITELIDRL